MNGGGVDWPDLIRRVRAFQDDRFPEATAKSCADHLLEEAGEVAASPLTAEEWADCWMLVVCGADKAGIDLYAAAESKLAVCLERQWRVGAGGYHKHVKANEEDSPDA